ncbi:MAG: flagellar protein FlgN [Oscillibacter sp.]|nr:flagellar protein FlgN [Oscillibacter sp.]
MDNVYNSYLELLDTLRSNVEELSALAKRKIEAAQNDDLVALDEVLKREQALALSFRGLEQSKERLLGEMGMKEVPLSQLPARYPLELRESAQKAVAALQDEYQIYQESAKAARTKLEQNLYEVESVIAGMGGPKEPQEAAGPGYAPPAPSPQPPQSMRTDFRA